MSSERDRISGIVEKIISRATQARGVVVLDNNLLALEPALREANIIVVKLQAGNSDDDIKERLLPHRIIVTTNPADFLDDAPVYEYGIVALEKLAFIDFTPEFGQNKTVQLISQALRKYGLWTKGANFHLELRDDGNHQLTELN